MNKKEDTIDDLLKEFLQCDIELQLNDRTIKKGKLILFDHGHFHYIFHLQTSKKKTSMKIPFPFDFYLLKNQLYFDYRVEKFTNGIKSIEDAVKKIKIDNPSKYYNNVLKIICL